MKTKFPTFYMERALKLAKKGEGYTGTNPLVGAVVVKDGKIVGEGYHRFYGGPHAEVYALNEAGKEAQGGTIYVNLEPCCHFGKTPPCTKKIINSGIKRAVIAMEDPFPEVAGKGIKQLKKAGLEVDVGLLEKEARELNEVFIKYITSDFPYVYLKTAQTLDGYLATKTGNAKWITNKKARLEGHKLRHKVDAVLTGIGTVLKDNPSLTTRLKNGDGKDSIRIVLDARLETPLTAKILNQDSDMETVLVIGEQVEEEKREAYLKKENVILLPVNLNEKGRIPLEVLLKKLHSQKFSSILVEAGGRVNYSFLKKGLVDKIYTFIASRLLGGSDGVPVFSGKGPREMENIKPLKEVKYKIFEDNILCIGKF